MHPTPLRTRRTSRLPAPWVMLLALAFAIAGCAPPGGSASSQGSGAEEAADVAGEGGDTDLGDTLNLATWPNYHDPEILERFTEETGVAVNLNVYGSTEEMETLLRAGNSGIDIAVPSNYAVEGWIADGLVEELDYSRLGDTDLSTWDPLFVDQQFDPGNRYTIPKNWGTTGIAQMPEADEPVTSWKEFFAAAADRHPDRGVIVDHQISTIGSAAVALGYSFNTIDPDELAEVEAMLTELKPKLFAITSDVQPPLRNRDSWLSMAWTGDGVQVVRDNPDAAYRVAEDGGELWVDSWSIAADAPHRDAAYAFLEFILRPENSAADTEFCLFPHANPRVQELIPEEIAGNEVIYPPQDLLQKLEFATSETYNSALRTEMWARVKSSA
jgi:spermidine/putrescine transport system substrate-binding protein